MSASVEYARGEGEGGEAVHKLLTTLAIYAIVVGACTKTTPLGVTEGHLRATLSGPRMVTTNQRFTLRLFVQGVIPDYPVEILLETDDDDREDRGIYRAVGVMDGSIRFVQVEMSFTPGYYRQRAQEEAWGMPDASQPSWEERLWDGKVTLWLTIRNAETGKILCRARHTLLLSCPECVQ